MIVRLVWLGLLSVAVLGCEDSSSAFVFDARIVDGENGNPAAGTDVTTLRIGIQEGDQPAQEFEYPVVDGDFDAVLALTSFGLPARLRIELEGPSTRLLTAPPAFVPVSTGGILRVVTAAPSTCERIDFDFMEAPRARFGMVQSGTFALLVGGTEPTEEQVEFLDLLEWESRLFTEELSLSALGETRAASIDVSEILVLPTNATPFIFNMVETANRTTSVVLHSGAGPRSALVSVPGVGAMVIGGELGGEPQEAVSLGGPGGAVTSLQLSEPRSGAAATTLGTDVLVVGGDPVGNAEILREGDPTGDPVTSLMDGIREDGVLVGDGETRALLVGGTDDAGVIRQDTVRFDGCPDSCVSSNGPTWTTARLEVLLPARGTLLIGGTDSRLVEEVRWSGADVAIESLMELNLPRAAAGGIVLESGVFMVGGGDDGVSVREDYEFCVPEALVPLEG